MLTCLILGLGMTSWLKMNLVFLGLSFLQNMAGFNGFHNTVSMLWHHYIVNCCNITWQTNYSFDRWSNKSYIPIPSLFKGLICPSSAFHWSWSGCCCCCCCWTCYWFIGVWSPGSKSISTVNPQAMFVPLSVKFILRSVYSW